MSWSIAMLIGPHQTSFFELSFLTIRLSPGLRPVRSEVRAGGAGGALLEARAALASPEPSPAEAKAAVEWALQHLAK